MEPSDIQPDKVDIAPPEPAPETEKPAEVVVEKPAALDAKTREERLAKVPDILKEAFDQDDIADDELDEVLANLTADKVRSAPSEHRVLLRAIARREAAEAERRAADKAKVDAEIADARAKLAEEQKKFRIERNQLLQTAVSAAPVDPGAPPTVDPFTPEGQAALAEYHAKKQLAAQNAPMRAKARELAKAEAWIKIVEKYPDLRDQKVQDEFMASLRKANEGLDEAKLASGEIRPRVTTVDHARNFFNERLIAKLTAEAAERDRRQNADRAASARAMGRTGTGAAPPDELARYKQIKKNQGEDAALEYLESNPKARAAVLGAAGLA